MRLTKKDGTYYVSFRTADNRTKTISTRCTNEKDAARVVQESGLKDLEIAARAGRLTAEAIGHITTGRKMTMEKAVEEFPAYLRSIARSEKTIDNYAGTLRLWLKFAKCGHLPPASIAETHIAPFINQEGDAKATTRTAALSAISSLFDWCLGNGWAARNPTNNVHVIMNQLSHRQKEKKEVEIFTKEEVRQLLKATSEQQFWHFAITVAWNYALRLGDICQLEWACFDQPGKMIVWTDKRDKRIAVPISDNFSEFVTTIPVLSPQYLFPEQRDVIRDVKKRSRLSVQFMRLCDKCDIKGKSFHTLRHTRITEWNKQGKSLEDIGELVGHSSAGTTAGYVH